MIEIEGGSGSSLICRPFGDIDVRGSRPLRHLANDLREPGLSLVIDLRRVRLVEAAGVGALRYLVRRVRALGGTVRIRNACPRVQWLIGLCCDIEA